jgi:hypothetical protein
VTSAHQRCQPAAAYGIAGTGGSITESVTVFDAGNATLSAVQPGLLSGDGRCTRNPWGAHTSDQRHGELYDDILAVCQMMGMHDTAMGTSLLGACCSGDTENRPCVHRRGC